VSNRNILAVNMITKHFTIDFINQRIYPLGLRFFLETIKPVYWFIFYYNWANFSFLYFIIHK